MEAPCSAIPSVMLCRRCREAEGLGPSGSTMPCGMKVSLSWGTPYAATRLCQPKLQCHIYVISLS